MGKRPDEVRQVVVTDPDPTAAVKEALELAIKNLDDKIDRRFQGIDQATILAREELRDKLQALKDTIVDSADARAEANKDLVEKLERSNQTALQAALTTQKEFIEQLQKTFEASNKVTNEKIDRLTSRLDTGEGRIGGGVDYRNYIIALIMAGLALAAFFGLGLHR